MTYVIILAILLFLISMTYVLWVRLCITLRILPDDKILHLDIMIWRFRVYTYMIVLEWEDTLKLYYYRNKELIKIWEPKDGFNKKKKQGRIDITDAIDLFLDKKRSVVEKLNLEMEIGLTDAAVTAQITGLAIIIINGLLAYLYNRKGMPKKSEIRIVPNFKEQTFHLLFEGILSVRLFHMMIAAIKVFFKKMKKKLSSGSKKQKPQASPHPAPPSA